MHKFTAYAAVVLGAALAFAVPANAADGSAFVGTWNLNLAKSSARPNPLPKSDTLVTTDAGGGKYKTVEDSVNSKGVAMHMEVTYTLDGKPAAVTPAPAAGSDGVDAYAVTLVDAKTEKIVGMSAGKPVFTFVATISADGKTQTGTSNGKAADGTPTTETDVYDKK